MLPIERLTYATKLLWSVTSGHSEVVRVQYNPAEVSYESLLDVFWDRHDPTTLNRQVKDSYSLSDATLNPTVPRGPD